MAYGFSCFLIFLINAGSLYAQDISGTWRQDAFFYWSRSSTQGNNSKELGVASLDSESNLVLFRKPGGPTQFQAKHTKKIEKITLELGSNHQGHITIFRNKNGDSCTESAKLVVQFISESRVQLQVGPFRTRSKEGRVCMGGAFPFVDGNELLVHSTGSLLVFSEIGKPAQNSVDVVQSYIFSKNDLPPSAP